MNIWTDKYFGQEGWNLLLIQRQEMAITLKFHQAKRNQRSTFVSLVECSVV